MFWCLRNILMPNMGEMGHFWVQNWNFSNFLQGFLDFSKFYLTAGIKRGQNSVLDFERKFMLCSKWGK